MKRILTPIIFVLFMGIANAQSWDSVGYLTKTFVQALTVYNGNLIAGSQFGVSQWNGSNWSALGKGINGQVSALSVYNGNLIAAGQFDSAGGLAVNNIAQWNGSVWSALGQGISGTVYSQKWVGTLCVYNNNLFAAGQFDSAGGIVAHSIAQWNGSSWSTLGKGIDNVVYALAVYDSNLIAGGQFDSVGGIHANGIAEWNGTSWSVFGGFSVVQALAVYDSSLLVGVYSSSSISMWNGTSWSTFGKPVSGIQNVEAMVSYNGNLVAGGMFDAAGGIHVNNVAEWTGSNWDSLGSGLDGGPGADGIETFAVYNSTLFAGGQIIIPNTYEFAGVARWGGSPTLIVELSSNNIVNVFPNPSSGIFTIQTQGVNQKCELEVYDMLGEKVYTRELTSESAQINLQHQPQGIYLYRLLTEKGEFIQSGKLVIQ